MKELYNPGDTILYHYIKGKSEICTFVRGIEYSNGNHSEHWCVLRDDNMLEFYAQYSDLTSYPYQNMLKEFLC